MFDSPEEKPILTGSAISWLLEDYGMSRTETIPADIQHRKFSRQWSSNPLPAVANHPSFCPCPRWCKWNPHATLHSVEYNWSLILGPKSTTTECRSTYKKFLWSTCALYGFGLLLCCGVFKCVCGLVRPMECDHKRYPVFWKSPWISPAFEVTISTYPMGSNGRSNGHNSLHYGRAQVFN